MIDKEGLSITVFTLTAELLDVYRSDVVALQGRAASAASPPPLVGLRHQLAAWQTLLPPMHGLLSDHSSFMSGAWRAAEPISARGGGSDATKPAAAGANSSALVATIRDAAARCGAPPLSAALRRLAWHADQTLFRQLSAW